MADAVITGHEDHGKPNFFTRWFMSTNHKDIGILYLFTAALLGFISVAFTVYMRLELMEPGVQYMLLDEMPNGHLWNVLITGHGILMMLFVVIPALFGGFGNFEARGVNFASSMGNGGTQREDQCGRRRASCG